MVWLFQDPVIWVAVSPASVHMAPVTWRTSSLLSKTSGLSSESILLTSAMRRKVDSKMRTVIFWTITSIVSSIQRAFCACLLVLMTILSLPELKIRCLIVMCCCSYCPLSPLSAKTCVLFFRCLRLSFGSSIILSSFITVFFGLKESQIAIILEMLM